ncbi:4237_t:CDS:2 [Ambispora gerdemannii]|uniref:4237_t:CDS:1 n=1 Tax=Ambispora gerdemannii TaxID=144530 RepID=A0A9N8WCL2_9GLOM|nr:4237_t:CDS:2 [Ambispora gerdemannii]
MQFHNNNSRGQEFVSGVSPDTKLLSWETLWNSLTCITFITSIALLLLLFFLIHNHVTTVKNPNKFKLVEENASSVLLEQQQQTQPSISPTRHRKIYFPSRIFTTPFGDQRRFYQMSIEQKYRRQSELPPYERSRPPLSSPLSPSRYKDDKQVIPVLSNRFLVKPKNHISMEGSSKKRFLYAARNREERSYEEAVEKMINQLSNLSIADSSIQQENSNSQEIVASASHIWPESSYLVSSSDYHCLLKRM